MCNEQFLCNRVDSHRLWLCQTGWIAVSQLFLATGLAFVAANAWAAGMRESVTHATASVTAKVRNTHPIAYVEADVYVNRFRTTVRLRCFADDLELLHGLEPDDEGYYDPDEIRALTVEHGRFLVEHITVTNMRGQRIAGRLTETMHVQIPDHGVQVGELMNYMMSYVVEYAYDEPPEFLTIQQDIIDENFLLPSELKLIIKQAGTDAAYRASLRPGRPETYRFDWDRPPLSDQASQQEWEEWFEHQREEMLGITSYSSVYQFVYIERFEVRTETLIPLASLATMIDFPRDDEAFLTIEEQEDAARRVAAFFSIGNKVVIDGQQVEPVVDRVDFYGLDLRDFAMQAERRTISMVNGRVGIILRYPLRAVPQNVSISWDKFNAAVTNVEVIIFSDEQTHQTQFARHRESNSFQWTNEDYQPVEPIIPVRAANMQRPPLTVSVASLSLILLGIAAIGLRLLWSVTWLAIAAIAAAFFVAAIPASQIGMVALPVDDPWAAPYVELEDKHEIFSQLHGNLFRAFDYREESEIYDALAATVEGPLLQRLYLQVIQSLTVREQGGAVARIDEVEVVEGEPVPSDHTDRLERGADDNGAMFQYRCRWNLKGTIEHWGHIHQRINQYDAQFTVAERDGLWKIIGLETLDERQGQVRTSLRRF